MENDRLTKSLDFTLGWRKQLSTVRIVFWISLFLIVMIISVYFNWLHWGSTALFNDDIHREFVTPLRLAKGEVVYKDFNFVYAPLPQYLNSWIIGFFPSEMTFNVLRSVALTLFLLNLLFLWFICRDIRLSWIFGPVLFGIVAWIIPYTYNPTSFNIIYTTLFATFGTWCAVRTLKDKRWPWVCLGIASAGALLSKPEGFFIVALASVGAYVYNVRLHKKLLSMGGLRWTMGFLTLAVPFVSFLFYKGLSWQDLIDGVLQIRFQRNLSAGFFSQLDYFRGGINHVIVIVAGCVFIALIFYLIKVHQLRKRFIFWLILFVSVLTLFILAFLGQLIRIINDYQNLGDFFGGILGYWWYRQLPDGDLKKGFFIFWLSSLGGWLRPLFHIGVLVIPFKVGGGMLLATIFWFLILPSFFKKVYPNLAKNSEWITNIFIKIGCICVLVFGITGLYTSWNSQWKYPTFKVKTSYGNFLANRNEESTQLGIEVISWLRQNLQDNRRFVAFEGLPIELIFDLLPCLPLASQSYQIYDGDTERIISILDKRNDIEYVLIYVRHGSYHFGIQDYKLADYLDTKWRQIARFRIPEQLTTLSSMSPARKIESGLVEGVILYGRK